MNVTIRDERPDDASAIAHLTTAAFLTLAEASGTEAAIVGALRKAGALTVSLIAEADGGTVGHAAFSPATVGGEEGWFGLGPISVRPDLQRSGIGSRLMQAGLADLRKKGAKGCVLVGNPAFYGRFGFRSMSGLLCEGVPAENTMALCFGAAMPKGEIAFHPAFFTAS
jgi:putative acetyltransferase